MRNRPEEPARRECARTTEGDAYGLRLSADACIEIPGLLGERGAGVVGPRDVGAGLATQVTRIKVAPEELRRRWRSAGERPQSLRELRSGTEVLVSVQRAAPAGYLLRAAGLAEILVTMDGCEVICAPASGIPEWVMMLTSQALPLAATLQGLEPLHASGIVVAGSARLFSGPRGAGKSSIAAALIRRGGTLIADDVVTLEPSAGHLLAHSGPGMLQLRASEAARISKAELARLGRPLRLEGRVRFLSERRAAPAPFAELFLIERSDEGAPIERLDAVNPVELLASTFNYSVRTPERLVRQLDVVAALAASGGVHRLRIRSGQSSDAVAASLDEHFAGVAR